MGFRKYIRRNSYRWHRITSLVIAVPVLLWTLSGFLHPVMNSTKPEVRNQSLPAIVLDSTGIRLSLKEALNIHGVAYIQRSRIVKMYGSFYYQVRVPGQDSLSYISCYNAQWLPKGDEQYAANLAQRYLTDPGGIKGNDHHSVTANIRDVQLAKTPMHVIRPNISEVAFVKRFDRTYKASNKILPVHRVSFYREDGIRLYIDTETDKLVSAIDNKKAAFTRFFSFAHSWSFLDEWGIMKNVLIGLVSLLCMISAGLGFYVYNITGHKNSGNAAQKMKGRHRTLGNTFVLTTFLFAFSGGWHSLKKLEKPESENRKVHALIPVENLDRHPHAFLPLAEKNEVVSDISVVEFNHETVWQILFCDEKKKTRRYYTAEGTEVRDGEKLYAKQLASKLSGIEAPVTEINKIFRYNNSYSMMNKRLPVMEVAYGNHSSYVETATGMLVTTVDRHDRLERFSFSELHMHHYWEELLGKKWGRQFRNAFLIISTLGLLLLAGTGLLMYFKKKAGKKGRTAVQTL